MKLRVFLVFLFVLALGCTDAAYGQGATGTILGTVTDSTGAVVAGTTVDVTNINTAVVKTTQTSSSGDYTVPFLQPGVYRVSVEMPGFQKAVVDNVTLEVAQEVRENLTLKPGAVSQTVEVQASAVTMDTDTATVSQTVTQRQVDQLPLNGRNFVNLIFLTTGAVESNGEQGQMRQGAGNAISINGSRPESNNYTLDGVANVDTALGTPAVILSQDAIQEFKIQSDTYSAEYGFSANQVNIISKSGTNSVHGTAFEFLRNDAFDATKATLPGLQLQPKSKLRQNQFGYVLGGPVFIPKVYDGRNKTFFLANYEGQRTINGANLNFVVPTPATLGIGTAGGNANFSATGLPAVGTAACNAALAANNPCMPIDPLTGAPFPGNIIPAARFSNIAKVTAKLFPAPTSGNQFQTSVALPNNVDQQTYKIDQSFGSKWGSVFFRWSNVDFSNQNAGTASLPFGDAVFVARNRSWTISHTVSLGQSLVNNFRFGHLDAVFNQGGVAAPTADVTAMAIAGTFQNLPASSRLYPTIGIQNFGAVGSQANDVTTSDVPMWDFADSLTKVHGKHTFGVGFELRDWVQKRNLSADFLGNWGYNNNTILSNGSATGFNPSGNPGGALPKQGCLTTTCGTGNATADYLLGYYNNVSTFQPGPFTPTGAVGNLNQYHYSYFAPYFEDDWKVTNRLTLNLGLRWDFRTVPYEASNKMFWFDLANPQGGLCFADQALATQTVSGLGGPIAPSGNGFYRYCGRRNPADGSKTPFAPRLGFAYRAGDKTVIRGGYGIFFDASETREIDDSGDIYPFVVRVADNPTTDAANCTTCLPKLTNNMITPVSLHTVSAATDGGQFFAVIISERPHNPYVQQWSLSVQRQLDAKTTLEVNYVGNKGTHLLERYNIGQPLPPANNGASCAISLSTGDCPPSTRRPFANITSANGFLDSEWGGYSSYDAGNIKIDHRTGDLALTAIYTYSKALDDKSAAAGVGATNGFAGVMNQHDPRLDYGRSDFDVRHRFVTNFVYALPVGRGKRWGGSMNKALDTAVGGWQLGAIATFQKGTPYSILSSANQGLLVTFTQRANLVPGCNPNAGFTKTITEQFNTACFKQPAAGVFGNSGRNILTQPGINNWDVNLAKTFKFTERIGFQFRVETFNTFNHTQYGVDLTSASVGPGQGAVIDNINNTGLPAFGAIGSVRAARVMQLGGKLTF